MSLWFRKAQGSAEVGKRSAVVLRNGGQDFVGTAIPEHVRLPLAGILLLKVNLTGSSPLLAPHFPFRLTRFDDADSSVRHTQ